MKTIWKFPINHGSPQLLEIPKRGEPLHFDMQNGYPTLWVMLEPRESVIVRRFVIHGTGHQIEDGANYVGTCKDGGWIWHLFELPL